MSDKIVAPMPLTPVMSSPRWVSVTDTLRTSFLGAKRLVEAITSCDVVLERLTSEQRDGETKRWR